MDHRGHGECPFDIARKLVSLHETTRKGLPEFCVQVFSGFFFFVFFLKKNIQKLGGNV